MGGRETQEKAQHRTEEGGWPVRREAKGTGKLTGNSVLFLKCKSGHACYRIIILNLIKSFASTQYSITILKDSKIPHLKTVVVIRGRILVSY